MNFDYGNVLTRALQITWKHKSFWLLLMIPVLISFFIFATFAAPIFLLEGNEDLMGLVIVIWVVVLLLGMLISFLLATVGMNAVTLGVLRIERGEGSTSLMDLVRDSLPYFGRAFGATLIIQLSVGAVFTVFFLCVAALSVVTMGLASICLQPIMILLTPASFLLVAVIYGALVAVIDEGLGPWEAVKRAVQVVRDHVWKFIILALIVYFGTTFVTSIVIFPAMIPAMAGPMLIDSGMDMSGATFALIFIPFLCLFLGAMSLISGITGTFMAVVMEISYLRLRPSSEVVFASNEPQGATS
ncbi:MAG: hypothetical protein ACKOGC_05045 [Anaerolineae bacterium]